MLKTTNLSKGFSDQLERDGSLSKQHFLSLSPETLKPVYKPCFSIISATITVGCYCYLSHRKKIGRN